MFCFVMLCSFSCGFCDMFIKRVHELFGEFLIFLQLHEGDSAMDLRKFLLESIEACYVTCYVLLLHAKDGCVHQLKDYDVISEVTDISAGGLSLQMVPGTLIS